MISLKIKENFTNSNSKLESNELLKTLYKRINEFSNLNKTFEANNKQEVEKADKIKKEAKTLNNKEKEESNKALNNLVDKLIKKFDFEKQDENKNMDDLLNSKLYKNLIKKYSFAAEANENEFINNKNLVGSNYNNPNADQRNNRVNYSI